MLYTFSKNLTKNRTMETQKKSPVRFYSFDEFIEYGLDYSDNIVDGMPWSFEIHGYPVTHENDQCYLIPTETGMKEFTPNHMLMYDIYGKLQVNKIPGCTKPLPPPKYEISDQVIAMKWWNSISTDMKMMWTGQYYPGRTHNLLTGSEIEKVFMSREAEGVSKISEEERLAYNTKHGITGLDHILFPEISEGEIKQAASEYEKIACCEKDHPWLKEYVNEDFEAGAKWAITKGLKPMSEDLICCGTCQYMNNGECICDRPCFNFDQHCHISKELNQ